MCGAEERGECELVGWLGWEFGEREGGGVCGVALNIGET